MTRLKLLFTFFFIGFGIAVHSQDNSKDQDLFKKAISLKYVNVDSAIYYFNKGYLLNKGKKDTAKTIQILIELADLYGNKVNYGKSYDSYWEALDFADSTKDSVSIANIYRGLGWLYSFYKRDNEALKYYNRSIAINKKLGGSEISNVNNYYSIANLHRVNKEYELVRTYLDSCKILRKLDVLKFESPYITVEAAYLKAIDGNYNGAIVLMESTINNFKKNNPAYLVIVYALLGEINSMKGDFNVSLQNYLQSLEYLNTYKRHLNYRPIVYGSLADLYFKKKDIATAYNYLKKAKYENDLIFGARSDYNQYLLEIKDKYREGKEEQEQFINEQRIKELEHEDKVKWLQSTILVVSLVFTILFAYVFFRYLRNKHKVEKRIITEQQKIQLQEEKLKLKRQAEELEMKNKELTESALRLIEKDEFIEGIEKMISDKTEVVDLKKIKSSVKNFQVNSNANWEEFETRFVAINQSFYDKLNVDFPQLTQTDQKICALVKLNLPSKHMSKLLGISVESVHSSRYRLRKKLGLSRTDNLEEFINSL